MEKSGYAHLPVQTMAASSTLSRRFFSLALPLLLGFWVAAPLPGQDNSAPTLSQDAATGNFGQYPSTPVSSVLDTYEALTGKRLIRDNTFAQSGISISIDASGVSKAEMIKLIEANLLLNGVALIPVDDQTMKVIVLGQNKNPGSEGVKLYANAADLPTDDQVVSYYMPLNYISPTEAVGIFNQSTPPHQAYGVYTPAPSAQAVVLRDNVSVIRQLIALKELIDVPPAPVTHEFVQLTRADAEKMADLLNKMLGTTAGVPGQPSAPGGEPLVPARIGSDEPLLNERSLISGSAQILPVTRSNQLLIITRPVNMPFLLKLIAELDQPDSFAAPQRFPLKYVLAGDILPALEATLAQGKDEEDEIKKDTTQTGTNTPNQSAPGNTANSVGNGSSSGQGLNPVTPSLSAPPQNNVPTVVSIGKTRLMADNRSNSIIVFGSTDAISRISTMIDELDRKPLQVYLATVIGELTVSAGQEFGIDILQKFQTIGQGGLASSLITPTTATSNAAATTTTSGTTATTTSSTVPEPRGLTSALGFPLPEGLTLYGAIGSTLNAYVRALETTNRFKVISRPSVYTLNNKLAVIASGSQIPIPATTVSGVNNDNGLTTSSTTQYEGVLLELEIIPLINANHEVTLQIRQTNNTEGSSQVISGNSVPTILTQEINTEVTVPDKATIVIGGLISDTSTRKTSGVPWLSDIPGLGYLFKDTNKSKERDELIIMIQPTVVESDADQIAANETEKQRTILGQEALQAATGVPGAPVTVPLIPPQTGANPSVREPGNYNSKAATSVRVTSKTSPNPTVIIIPSRSPGIVPAVSSPAPDVGNAQVPAYPAGKAPQATP